MDTAAFQPIADGQYSEVIERIHEGAIEVAIEQIDYFEAIGDIDEDAAMMLRQGIRAAIRHDAMNYAGDASIGRRPNPRDGEMRDSIEVLRRDYAEERREHQRAIAIAKLAS